MQSYFILLEFLSKKLPSFSLFLFLYFLTFYTIFYFTSFLFLWSHIYKRKTLLKNNPIGRRCLFFMYFFPPFFNPKIVSDVHVIRDSYCYWLFWTKRNHMYISRSFDTSLTVGSNHSLSIHAIYYILNDSGGFIKLQTHS